MCEHKRTRKITFSGIICLDCGNDVIPKIRKITGLEKKIKKVGTLPTEI